MNIFVPLNKHLLIEKVNLNSQKKTLIELPDDYLHNSHERYTTVRLISGALDCDSIYEKFCNSADEIILAVDRSMIEEVIISNIKYSLIHQNNIVGVMEIPYEAE